MNLAELAGWYQSLGESEQFFASLTALLIFAITVHMLVNLMDYRIRKVAERVHADMPVAIVNAKDGSGYE